MLSIVRSNLGRRIVLLVGISMVFGGVSLIAMALDARAIKP